MPDQIPQPARPTVLKPKQQRRAAALLRARDALAAQSFMSKGKADALDLVSVASWIVTGLDPWASNPYHSKETGQ